MEESIHGLFWISKDPPRFWKYTHLKRLLIWEQTERYCKEGFLKRKEGKVLCFRFAFSYERLGQDSVQMSRYGDIHVS